MIASAFLHQNLEITILTMAFISIILSSYLYKLSHRSQFSIPIIRSGQEKWFHRYDPKLKKIEEGSMIKNHNNKYQKYRLIDKNISNKYGYHNQVKKNKRSSLSTIAEEYKNLPFVSIIVPARNEEEYIERCINSLLNQDYPSFEIIVVDDNSTDNTSKILENIKNNITNNTLPTAKSSGSVRSLDRLKIITLKGKPEGWTGKTWASQKGFLESKGDLLLFTDADTYYSKRDTIEKTVVYMQRDNLDVLTAIPTSEKLTNFWSKVTIPMWDFTNILFGVGSIAEVNNPKSKIAYLMGSFFMIKRKVFVSIGTFESVHGEIQEDKALGILIKKRGYKLRLVKLKDMVYTLWADDLMSLWHGIGRTVAPLVLRNKAKVLLNLFIIFFCCILPFVLFPIDLAIAFKVTFPLLSKDIHTIPFHIQFYLPIVSLLACLLVFVFSSIKSRETGIPMTYVLGTPIGSVFVFIACVYNIVPLLIHGNTKPILWQGRQYIYKKEQEGFAL